MASLLCTRCALSSAPQVCLRIREQLPADCSLVACQTCSWGWACSEHAAAHHTGAHQAHCATYALHTKARALTALMAAQTGQAPVWCPEGNVARLVKLPGSWKEYRQLRKWPAEIDVADFVT